MIETITKSSGRKAKFDANKLNRWAQKAAGYNVDWSTVALSALSKCFNGCTTKDLERAMIDACLEQETTGHLKMANQFYMGGIYKQAFGGIDNIPSLLEMYTKMVELGYWASMDYTEEELNTVNGFIDHNKDLTCTITESKQIIDKYAVVDRVNKKVYETPQFVYIRMALGNMEQMPKERRLKDIKDLYVALSEKRINAPTPFQINLGTMKKQYASCCVYTTEDTAASLSAGDHIAYTMTCAASGIGAHIKTRSKGDAVQGGKVIHLGKLPYYKVSQAVVGANLQSSRGGALTMHYNVLDPEIEDLIALRNVETVEQKRIKDIDYSLGYNLAFAKRVAKNEDWMLVSYAHAPKLYRAMYNPDQENFERLYSEVWHDKSIPKRIINARQVIAIPALTESEETGRQYFHRTDEMNRHTPFRDTIWSSNLCQEIGLPTKGYESAADLYEYEHSGEIGLCSLAAIDADTPDDEMEQTAYSALLMIDNAIEIMDYPFANLEYTAKYRRSVGVGITNLAYALAKRGLKYSSKEGKEFIHYIAERHSYWLHRASLKLAKERGICKWMFKTKYPLGWLPIDTRNTECLEGVNSSLKFDWEALRNDIKDNGGIRNSVLEAHMPCESSSIASGHTNGLYPIRALRVIKTSGNNLNVFIAPEAERLEDKYELAWDIPHKDLAQVYGIIQGFTGQAISADFYRRYPAGSDRKVGTSTLLTEFLTLVKYGVKTKYYQNSSTSVQSDDDCSSCKL